MKNNNFENAFELNKKYPNTFELFDKKFFEKLSKNDNVKVIRNKERFWISIEKINFENNTIEGLISNDLVLPQNNDIKFGDKVEIDFKNIIDILFKKLYSNEIALKEITNYYENSNSNNNLIVKESEFNCPIFLKTYNKYFI